MENMSSRLTFRHGIHPEAYKDQTADLAIERMPFVEEYAVPVAQHAGAPSVPLVQKGQHVTRGDVIARPDAFVSVAQHAPVTGTVTGIELGEHPNGLLVYSIRIKADPYSAQTVPQRPPLDWKNMGHKEFIAAVQSAGLVGLGGAGFPAHVKFSIPEGKTCTTIIANGCECEPFLTSDHRIMVEFAADLVHGLTILRHFVPAQRVVIGVEDNKPDAIAALQEEIKKQNCDYEVVALRVKYPQGAEKMLIKAVLGTEVPSGKLPLDVGALVSNVGTLVALAQYFENAVPLIERVVTVTGPAIRKPANLMVPIGTPIRHLIDWCGGVTQDAVRILLGGPMMGIAQKTLDVPVTKGISGVLVLTDNEVQELSTYQCIKCGRCIDVCPMFLNPSLMGLLSRKDLYDELEEQHVMDCFECASCSFVCPSGIPLVQSFRVAKNAIRERKAKASSKPNPN
ncbi:electron transport complex subunit RsxC [bacterium]|nr:electron transport complex subunit RsxC [bacterium]NUN45402.1 electron transport complex subunit RsxC [bacterium]HMW32761.1 electron transport complex subunit RsxC [bacterium]HMY36400.1 electron transport complex subunit RsxC [bacterium]HMZ04684.1 electron transport complex subunit RsxC [bacterium]